LQRKVAAHRPDVAIIDVQMPPGQTDDGLRAAIQIRRAHPEMGVLMLSQFRDEAYALDLIGENARGVGYLLKDRLHRPRRRGCPFAASSVAHAPAPLSCLQLGAKPASAERLAEFRPGNETETRARDHPSTSVSAASRLGAPVTRAVAATSPQSSVRAAEAVS
jgi:CheY-like chemotaxis protein